MTENGSSLLPVSPFVQPYAWGSIDALADFLQMEPNGKPMAEAWYGVHPGGPSTVVVDGVVVTLTELVRRDPAHWFGTERSQPGMSFLLKILAIDAPLSLQLHPTIEQARAGFAEENGRGVDPADPRRVFRDENHKPELICALTELDALCGFRPTADSIEFLTVLGGALAERMVRAITAGVSTREIVLRALTPDDELVGAIPDERVAATDELVSRADAALGSACPERFCLAASWIATLGRTYRGDGGVAVAALLNCVRLEPGQALFLPAGNMHAYLRGLGVEIMANSDNVVRGGLTPKHVDVETLSRLVDTTPNDVKPMDPTRSAMAGGARLEEWSVPVADFALSRVSVAGSGTGSLSIGAGPAIVLCAEGSVVVSSNGSSATVAKGVALVAPARATLGFSGYGECFIATPGAR